MKLLRSIGHGVVALASLIVASLVAAGSSGAAPNESAAVGARAAIVDSAPVRTEHTEAQLIVEGPALPGETLWAGLRLEHIPKWHSYWRNPGDSGLATEIEWTLPAGWSAGEILWPAPHRLPVGPFVNYGFEGEVVLPVPLRVPSEAAVGSTVRVEAAASWLVCEEICIPEEGRFAVDLSIAGPDARSLQTDAGQPDAGGPLFRARQDVPKESPWAATVGGDADNLLLHVAAPGLRRDRLSDVYFFPHDPEAIEHAGEQKLAVDEAGLTLRIPRGIAKGREIGPLEGVLVLEESLDGGTVRQAFEIAAEPGSVTAPAAAAFAPLSAAGGGGASAAGFGLLYAVVLAIGGGLLLNLMPCVFPVLFIKALGLARLGAGQRREVRLHGLAYTAGVLATFGLLAGALIALQQSGAVIGWGFQLQQPVVILLLAYLMTLIGLNLAGLFEVRGGGNVGAELAARSGNTGAFFTGALAVVVATPCTAPFMGVALGFAVTQPPAIALGIFLALGLGMALPFLLLSLFPGAARFLPKPGAWMERFKQFLAFPMFATAAWLVWVLVQQVGPAGVAVASAGILLIAFGAWVWNLLPAASGREAGRGGWRLAARAVGIAAFAAALLLLRLPLEQPARAGTDPVPVPGSAVTWQTFDPDRIAALRGEGKAVLVNLTAAWCITCQVNERVALSSPSIGKALEDGNVVPLKGDWTNGDPIITRYLSGFGRTGVPLYVLYPAGEGEPTVLPQLLTESIVRNAITALPDNANKGARS